ncbi:hypothetical protein pipiens_008555 [Culex pipiens pipiens]|uniref:Uncharacterized protein n=1 Tax=Culex pipiens pipiens TaxID=38569 RepID=A0ABD1DH57_CULPP
MGSLVPTGLYSNCTEKTQCAPGQGQIMLSLVLRSHSWDELVEKKRQKAVNKLSKFFLVPKVSLSLSEFEKSSKAAVQQ